MQYDYFTTETKMLNKKLPIFMLIIELIKLFVFITTYNFFKNHNKYNLYCLSIVSFFIISFKVIFLMLFLLLNHNINNDFKTYLLNNTNNFMSLFEGHKIEFHQGQIDFNFSFGSDIKKSVLELMSKSLNNPAFNLKNYLYNKNSITAIFEKRANILAKYYENSQDKNVN